MINAGIVRGYGAGVSPVPVQTMAALCRGGAKGIEKDRGSVEDQIADHGNRLADLEVRIAICQRNALLIPGEIGLIGSLQGFCRL